MLKDLFIIRGSSLGLGQPEKGEMVAAGRARRDSPGVFITPKSISTFPVASFIVTIIWLLAQKLFPAWGSSIWVPVLASLFVGVVVFLATTSDKEAKPQTPQEWFVSGAVAFFNSLYLAASALGLLSAISKMH
jgi:hypothetical protein